jgi:hypothetical protein
MKIMARVFPAVLCALLVPVYCILAQTITTKSVEGEAFISSEYMVNARADSIIMRLGVSDTLAQIMGYQFCSGVKRFLQIGDAIMVAPQKDKYLVRDTGIILISYAKMPTEVRFTFEPKNGAYVYQDQWNFTPSAGIQTKIVFSERYIDSQGPLSSGKIADWTRLIRERLDKLKAIAERK